jgi:hypothetical protein
VSITLVVGALILVPVGAVSAGTPGWNDAYGDGRVTVPADRSSIKVCDAKVDNLTYKAVWHNDNPIDARKPFEVRAPQGGCATDSSPFGSLEGLQALSGAGRYGHAREVGRRCGRAVVDRPT